MHLDQNSGPKKTQVFGKTQVFSAETQDFSPKNSGIRRLFFVLSTKFFPKTHLRPEKLRSNSEKLRYSETKCLFLFEKSAQKSLYFLILAAFVHTFLGLSLSADMHGELLLVEGAALCFSNPPV